MAESSPMKRLLEEQCLPFRTRAEPTIKIDLTREQEEPIPQRRPGITLFPHNLPVETRLKAPILNWRGYATLCDERWCRDPPYSETFRASVNKILTKTMHVIDELSTQQVEEIAQLFRQRLDSLLALCLEETQDVHQTLCSQHEKVTDEYFSYTTLLHDNDLTAAPTSLFPHVQSFYRHNRLLAHFLDLQRQHITHRELDYRQRVELRLDELKAVTRRAIFTITHPDCLIRMAESEPVSEPTRTLHVTEPFVPITLAPFDPTQWKEFMNHCEQCLVLSIARLDKKRKRKKNARLPQKRPRFTQPSSVISLQEDQLLPDDLILTVLSNFHADRPSPTMVGLFCCTLNRVCKQWERLIRTTLPLWRLLVLGTYTVFKRGDLPYKVTEDSSTKELCHAVCLDSLNHQCELRLNLYTGAHRIREPYKTCGHQRPGCLCIDLSDSGNCRPIPAPRPAPKGDAIDDPSLQFYTTLREHAMRFRRMSQKAQSQCVYLSI